MIFTECPQWNNSRKLEDKLQKPGDKPTDAQQKIKTAERISIFSLPCFVTLSDGKICPLTLSILGKNSFLCIGYV